jgi:hypothetical protein
MKGGINMFGSSKVSSSIAAGEMGNGVSVVNKVIMTSLACLKNKSFVPDAVPC